MRGLLHGACVVAVVAVVAVGPSAAAADWEPPFALSQSAPNFSSGEGPDVAAAPDGSFVAAWFLPIPSPDDDSVIQARRVDPGGEPGPVLTLTAEAGDLHRVRVATGPAGDAIVYWHRQVDEGADSVLEARRISADGSLGPPLVISESGDRAGISAVAIDSAGDATVVWGAHPATSGFKLRTRRLPASGPPGPAVTVPNENEGFLTDVAVAVGPDRRPLVAFAQLGIVGAVRLDQSGEPLDGITLLSEEGDVSEPVSMGMDGSGVARIAWGRTLPEPGIVSTRTVAPDGTLGPTEVVTERDTASAEVAVNENGAAAIVWQQLPADEDDDQESFHVAGAASHPDGSFGAGRTLSPPSAQGARMSPHVAIDTAGVATVVWQRNIGRGGTGIVEAARFSNAGPVGGVAALSDPAKTLPQPRVAAHPGGTALSAWVQAPPNPDTFRIKAARFAPPPAPQPPNPPGPSPGPTPECHDKPATIVGTSHDNDIVGTPHRDVIDGGPGDDRIKGIGGDDVICGRGGDDDIRGNKGDDAAFAGDGDDRAAGGAGDDALRGQAGDDELVGGVNADSLAAGEGSDLARAGRGDDRVHTRAGRDRALGGRGRDGISGGAGEDDLAGGGANDGIYGGPQDDFLDGDRGVNRCRGGGGVNILVRCQR